MRTIVVGATGMTGRFVVLFLLAKKLPVSVFVRSKDRMLEIVKDSENKELLTIIEGSVLDVSSDVLEKEVAQADAIVSCLGHNLTFQGIFGKPRRLVTDSLERLLSCSSSSMSSKKFILMNSEGVFRPGDDVRSRSERAVLYLLRHLIAPHADNEKAAEYLASQKHTTHWVGVRPTDLIDTPEASEYKLYDKPTGSLFGSGAVSRANVAQLMVDLLTDEDFFLKYKGSFPVVHDLAQP